MPSCPQETAHKRGELRFFFLCTVMSAKGERGRCVLLVNRNSWSRGPEPSLTIISASSAPQDFPGMKDFMK